MEKDPIIQFTIDKPPKRGGVLYWLMLTVPAIAANFMVLIPTIIFMGFNVGHYLHVIPIISLAVSATAMTLLHFYLKNLNEDQYKKCFGAKMCPGRPHLIECNSSHVKNRNFYDQYDPSKIEYYVTGPGASDPPKFD